MDGGQNAFDLIFRCIEKNGVSKLRFIEIEFRYDTLRQSNEHIGLVGSTIRLIRWSNTPRFSRTASGDSPAAFISAKMDIAVSHSPPAPTAAIAVLKVTLSGLIPARLMLSKKPGTWPHSPRLRGSRGQQESEPGKIGIYCETNAAVHI